MTSESPAEADHIGPLIDTHCHLDDESFAGDLDEVIERSRASGVEAWINVGYAPDRWDASVCLSRRVPGMAHMLGVHPSHAQDWSPDIARRLRALLIESGARAVGEIGLDFYRDNAPLPVQRLALLGQLELARELGLPVVFHLRDAEAELLEILEAERELPRMVFHSFDGTERLARFVVERGAVVGVGGLATRQRFAPLRELLHRIPLASMVLETDSPYLMPARQRGRRNEPRHVRSVATFLGDHLGVSLAEVARQTTANAERFFGSLIPS